MLICSSLKICTDKLHPVSVSHVPPVHELVSAFADRDEVMKVEDSDEGSSNAPGRKRGCRKGAAAQKKRSGPSLVLVCSMKP